jgi:hypothetical protein
MRRIDALKILEYGALRAGVGGKEVGAARVRPAGHAS